MATVSDESIGLQPIPRVEFVEKFLEHINPIEGIEYLPLEECGGRILAKDMVSRYMLPSGRTAGGDSVVMRWSAFKDGNPTPEQTAQWVEGVDWAHADMGDDFADIFDCATRVESVEFLDNGGIRLTDDPPHIIGPEGIKQPGSTMQVGDPLLSAGEVLTPTTMALLASAGHTIIPVRRKVRIAFIPTGSELCTAGEVLQRGKTPDSNSYMIRQLIINAGAEPVMFPIIVDTKEALADALARAREVADLVLINGGSSKGSEDFNAILLSEGASFYHHGVLLRPARVAAASVIDGIPHVNLPGPTMAAHVVWEWCVRHALAKLQGIETPARAKIKAELIQPKGGKGPGHGPKPGGPKPGGMRAPEEHMSFYNVTFEDGRYVARTASRDEGPASTLRVNAVRISMMGEKPSEDGLIEVEML